MKTREKSIKLVFHKMMLIILFSSLLILLSACAKQESGEVKGFPSSTTGSDSKDTQNAGSGMKTEPDGLDSSVHVEQETEETKNFSSSTAGSGTETEPDDLDPMDEKTVAEVNREVLTACAGMTITQTIESDAGRRISIDAQVDVDGVSRVSRYKYIPQQFTEERRKALLKQKFPAEDWDVNEAAMYNEKEDAWEIVTPRGESWVCQVRDSQILGEQIINIERIDIALDYAEVGDVSPIRLYNTPDADKRLLYEIINSKTSEIEQIGQIITAPITEEIIYFCNYIYICGEDGGHPYAKAVFKRTVDGMPVTAWHNFSTATSKESHFPMKVWGSFYSMEEIGLTETILTPTEAVAAMQEQIDFIQMQETQMCVTKISLEYLAVISSKDELEIVPIWRFWMGNDEMERNMMCEQIFAVNAVSGELIWENRGVFTE